MWTSNEASSKVGILSKVSASMFGHDIGPTSGYFPRNYNVQYRIPIQVLQCVTPNILMELGNTLKQTASLNIQQLIMALV